MSEVEESRTADVSRPPKAVKLPLVGEELWDSIEASLRAEGECISEGGCQSLLIFDWDDTLHPTAALAVANRLAPGAVSAGQVAAAAAAGAAASGVTDSDLEACANAAVRALRAAKALGRVVIVTNAINGWVHDTAFRFMPQIIGELATLTVISARSVFEPLGVTEPWRWKTLCFRRLLDCFPCDPNGLQRHRNLFSIGDSWHERSAAIAAVQDVGSNFYVKSLKLTELPSPERLAFQLDRCTEHLSWLAAFDGHLDLQVTLSGALEPVEILPRSKAAPVRQTVISAEGRGTTKVEIVILAEEAHVDSNTDRGGLRDAKACTQTVLRRKQRNLQKIGKQYRKGLKFVHFRGEVVFCRSTVQTAKQGRLWSLSKRASAGRKAVTTTMRCSTTVLE